MIDRTAHGSFESIAQGHYYRKQLGSSLGVISWSHSARFKTALQLVGHGVPNLLDYGSGDGTFLALASPAVTQAIGVDISQEQIADCRRRLRGFSNLQFHTLHHLKAARHTGAYHVVTCMETLEHCTAPVVENVLRELARLVSPAGRVIISVPIETGGSFLVKYAARNFAAYRNVGDYKYYEKYSWRNAWKMIAARDTTLLDRPVYGPPDRPSHSHYGFNWRALRNRVRAHLVIEQTTFSPLAALGGLFASQAWFVCRRKPAGPRSL